MQVDQPLSLKFKSVDLRPSSDRQHSCLALDLEQHCQDFLDLVVDYLSLPVAWVLRRDQSNQLRIEMERFGASFYGQSPIDVTFAPSSYLTYPSSLFPKLVEKTECFEQPGLQHWVYQDWYVFSSSLDWQQGQYLLFISNRPLSASERHWVDRQILLISDYLDLHSAYRQQQATGLAKAQHLQQTLHQLGTPLSLITLYADLLRTKTQVGESQDYLMPLQEAVKQLHRYLQDLVDEEEEDKPTVEQCDLRDLVDENVQRLRPYLEAQGINICLPQTSELIWVDRWQILQVFDNLLSNAIHFSPSGSKISLDWQCFQSEILIEVRDQGPGLSTEDLCCMFSPYYSRRQGGRGLGLAIAQQIVCRHRGRLWASNLPEGGAQFSISLPQESKI